MTTTQTQKQTKRSENPKSKGKQKNHVQRQSKASGTNVTASVATTNVRKKSEPRINRAAKNGDVIVEHEEYIQDINGSPAFSIAGLPVNPGQAGTFPWLSQMAPLYESYRFESLRFDFRTEAPTTASGSVMLALDYDASDALAPTKQALASYRGYVRSAPWCACSTSSLSEDLNKRKSYYVRTSPLSANQDIKLYDTANVEVAVNGQADASVVGELYVKYRVRLMTPQLQITGVGQALGSSFLNATGPSSGSYTRTGNAPVTAVGTLASTTFTSTQPFQALIYAFWNGTTFVGNAAYSGSATITATGTTVSGPATAASSGGLVNFTAAGQTLTVAAPGNASITYGLIRLAQFAVING